MTFDERDRDCEPVPSPDRPLSTGFLVFRAAATTILVLAGLVGAALAAVAGYFLVDIWRHPPKPPGQLAVGGFLAVAAAGVAIVLGVIRGLVLLGRWSRQLARRVATR